MPINVPTTAQRRRQKEGRSRKTIFDQVFDAKTGDQVQAPAIHTSGSVDTPTRLAAKIRAENESTGTGKAPCPVTFSTDPLDGVGPTRMGELINGGYSTTRELEEIVERAQHFVDAVLGVNTRAGSGECAEPVPDGYLAQLEYEQARQKTALCVLRGLLNNLESNF